MFAEKVNILGTEYKIRHETEKENPNLSDASGLCEWWSKELLLDFSDLSDSQTMRNIDEYKKKVLRHEMLHAFFFEAGHEKDWGRDEDLVNSLAVLMPKIVKAMQEARCL